MSEPEHRFSVQLVEVKVKKYEEHYSTLQISKSEGLIHH